MADYRYAKLGASQLPEGTVMAESGPLRLDVKDGQTRLRVPKSRDDYDRAVADMLQAPERPQSQNAPKATGHPTHGVYDVRGPSGEALERRVYSQGFLDHRIPPDRCHPGKPFGTYPDMAVVA